MSNWLAHDEFVDLVRNHHHDGFTGLLTGVSDAQHSFQIGFRAGQVVLLTYRILKGAAALEKIMLVQRAKITEHPNTELPTTSVQLPDTSSILSRLTLHDENDEGEPEMIINVNIPSQPAATAAPVSSSSGAHSAISPDQLKRIKAAAIHHFGPIGAMVCEESLSTENQSNNDLKTLLRQIAEEVGASAADTEAFLNSLS